MFAKFSPDGRRVGFVRENDLYVQDLADGRAIRLTSDGSTAKINGTFDWVYEEEFSLRDGFRWSPDGESIAYWQMGTSGMKDFQIVNTTDTLYPKLTPIRYPKVGQANPACRVGVVPSRGGETRWMDVPGDPRDHYIARMDWAGASELVLQHLNRLQNTDAVMLADAADGQESAHTYLTEDRHAAWVRRGRRPAARPSTTAAGSPGSASTRRLAPATSARAGGRAPARYPRRLRRDRRLVRVDEASGQVDFIASPGDPKRRATSIAAVGRPRRS